jgi:hypothetical protein
MANPSRLPEDKVKTARTYWQRQLSNLVVEQRKLSRTAWMRVFERLLKDLPEHLGCIHGIGRAVSPREIDPREPFLWAWCTLQAMPSDTGQDYKRLAEGSVASGFGIEYHAASLRSVGYRWTGLKTAKSLQIEWLAAVVRGLDADLTGIDFWPAAGEKWNQASWMPDGYPCFVVPVTRDYRLENHKDRERRATRYHAVVPAAIGDLTVKLSLHDQVSSSASSGQKTIWSYGAAVFPNMTVTTKAVGDDEFVVTEAIVDSDAHVITSQLGQALAARCEVLAWPELTMSLTRQDILKAALNADPLGDRRCVPIVVAGSWHVDEGGEIYNRAEAMTGRAKPLATCDKRRKFKFDDRYEAIKPGETLTVIVMEDRLVTVAICLDFCDDGDDEIYRRLGADVVIVPSMGDLKTVRAHERHAKELQSQHGTVSLIVQQHPILTGNVEPLAPPGYSFTVEAPRDIDVEQRPPYRTLQSRR